MPETHSKLAVAIAEVFMSIPPTMQESETLARAIDERLAEIREHYKPEELARCPIVSHHGKPPCAFCVTGAMRALILLPEEL